MQGVILGMYVCMHVCMYVCISGAENVITEIGYAGCVPRYVCMHVFMYVRICRYNIHMYMCVIACIRTYVLTCMHSK
jgi:hypothetical protein